MKLYEYMGFRKPSREKEFKSAAKDSTPKVDSISYSNSKREDLPDHVKIFLEDQQPLTSKQKILLKQILMEELK